MASSKEQFRRLNPRHRKRQERLDAHLKAEGNEWMVEILSRRREREEQEKAIDLALHKERREGSNWLENREIRVGALYIEWERGMIERRIALRRKLALECPDLVNDAELDKLERSMLSGVRTLKQAKRDEYERRARSAGIPIRRSEYGGASEYGELEAMVRREVEQLRLGRNVGRFQPEKKGWAITDRLTVWGWIIAGVVAIIVALLQPFGPEIRALFGLK